MFKDIMNLMAGQLLESVGFVSDALTQRFEIAIAFIGSPPFMLF